MSNFMSSLEKLAGSVSELLAGPVIPAALEIGKDVLELINKSKDVVEETDVTKLEAMRDELEPKVMAHADRTETDLRGS